MSQEVVDYTAARDRIERMLAEQSLELRSLEREMLERLAVDSRPKYMPAGTRIEQLCVNYLRHSASRYDEILRLLKRPDQLFFSKAERHVLHVECRRLFSLVKQRLLDEIAEKYPWLKTECIRQKWRDGVEANPGDFKLPFGPFKGRKLSETEADYLLRLLGRADVQRSLRTRIERHLADRLAVVDGFGESANSDEPFRLLPGGYPEVVTEFSI